MFLLSKQQKFQFCCSTSTELIIIIQLMVPHLYFQGIWIDELVLSRAGVIHILF